MKSNKGFTLVELLIVIALLGALAIGLIGALDPLEQIKKGTDTGVRNTVSEMQQAIIRYYALKGVMPWCVGDETGNCTGTGIPNPPLIKTQAYALSALVGNVVSQIVLAGELKTNFTTVQASQLTKVFVTGDATNALVCYMPESKSFQADKNTEYINNYPGTKDTDLAKFCKSKGGANSCYWCVQ